jgi:predicted O-linked N-acetylglucosamine transferase (SPINDLY family)
VLPPGAKGSAQPGGCRASIGGDCLALRSLTRVRLDEAVPAYGEALRLKQDYAEAGSNLLLCLNYDKRCSNAELYEAHRAWGQRHGRAAQLPVTYANDRATERRLKIGYVSPDFRGHSVAFFQVGRYDVAVNLIRPGTAAEAP